MDGTEARDQRLRTPHLRDIVDVATIGSLMSDFYKLTGIPMGIVDTEGNVLAGVGWQAICTQFHRVQVEAAAHCRESDTHLCKGIRPGEFRLYRCKNNMWDVATPIMVDDYHVGYVFCGQFFFEDEVVDRDVFRAQAERYGFDQDAYLAALDAVPRLSRAVVNAGVAFFVKLAHVLSQLGHTNLQLARAMVERDELTESLRRREEQLREAAEKLEHANRLKDEFLSTLSHELRTPLMAIVGWSQMLVTGTVQGDEAHRAAEVIFRSGQAQTRLIDDVLDVSRIITGKMRLDVRPTDLVPIVGSVVEAVRVSAEAKGISMATEFDPVPRIEADPSRLQQVFWNLLSNAVKFTPPGGRVKISVLRKNSHVEVAVTDTGVGIDAGFLPHVFERFRQHDSSTKRAYTGLGLGLAIVRHLIDLHGGTVTAHSAGEGQGSVFTVALPVRAVRPLREAKRTARAADAAVEQMPDLTGVCVLVVDDDAEAREMLRAGLVAAGARVTTAMCAHDALDELSRAAPDVLVSDVGMPEIDGCELMQRVRSLGFTLPAVAVSGYGRDEDRQRALAAGFDRHVTKPILPTQLASLVVALARPCLVQRGGI